VPSYLRSSVSRIGRAASTRIRRALAARWPQMDRRCRFHDLSKVQASARIARSPILQFYSSADNIGNYLPVLGIQQLLKLRTDTWCVYDPEPDFDFINSAYRGIIIGGAGLLCGGFDRFWSMLGSRCTLPMIVWGVGSCFPDNKSSVPVPSSVAGTIFSRCDLIDVRDDLTAEYYNLRSAHVGPCPSVAYLQDYAHRRDPTGVVLFSTHPGLTTSREADEIEAALGRAGRRYKKTDNCQSVHCGLVDIIERQYCRADIVVTTRLHGAIIAYALGIPYATLARDQKVRAFQRLYGNGIDVKSANELTGALLDTATKKTGDVRLDLVNGFAAQANAWLASLR
jgi:hypothetical protein